MARSFCLSPCFGYQTITVERPEYDDKGKVVKETKGKRKGKPNPDTKLRDTEDVPLGEDIDEYFQREVIPHVPDLPAAVPESGQFCVYAWSVLAVHCTRDKRTTFLDG